MTNTIETPETVTVEAHHLVQLVTTILKDGVSPHPEVGPAMGEALRAFDEAGRPPAGTDITLPAETVAWLHCGSYALGVYDLDEASAETYEHPAVEAEEQALHALMEQAPATDDRVSNLVNERINIWRTE